MSLSEKPLISRIAPTPSGFLHLGNAFNFLIIYLMVRSAKGKLILRIDDLDYERKRTKYVDDIFHSLEWLGIDWDIGPSGTNDFEQNWSQLHRRDLYNQAFKQLQQNSKVFACRCSRKMIIERQGVNSYDGFCLNSPFQRDDSPIAYRLNTSESPYHLFNYFDAFGVKHIHKELLHFPIVLKKNGDVSYDLSSVVDDILYEVNTIVRGLDLLPSTAVQQLIALNMQEMKPFNKISFIHHDLLVDNDGKKMSKSNDSTSLNSLKSAGLSKQKVYQLFAKWLGLNASDIRDIESLKQSFNDTLGTGYEVLRKD